MVRLDETDTQARHVKSDAEAEKHRPLDSLLLSHRISASFWRRRYEVQMGEWKPRTLLRGGTTSCILIATDEQ